LGEAGFEALARELTRFDALLSSNLLEAEVRSALRRESADLGSEQRPIGWISWVIPDRPLSPELNRVLAVGHLRGADLWHVACCLFLADRAGLLTFATADRRQSEVAERLGLQVLDLTG
jgi:hypothetical protein